MAPGGCISCRRVATKTVAAAWPAPLGVFLLAINEVLFSKVQAWQRSENKLMRLGGGIAMVVLGTLIFFL